MRVWQYTDLNIQSVGGVEKHMYEVSRALEAFGATTHFGLDAPSNWISEPSAPIVLHTHGDQWVGPSLLQMKNIFPRLSWIHVCHGTSLGRLLACGEYFSFSGWKGSLRDFLPTQFADAAIAVSENALYEARKYFRMKIPATVIQNGCDEKTFAPLASISKAHRLMFVGRSTDRVKNTAGLLRACSAVKREIDEFELWAAPGIESRQEFVKNLGPLKSWDLSQKLAQCRALALVSFYEGDPIVIHEAKSMGLGLIVSDLPQIRKCVGDYRNVIFINPTDDLSIANGIEKMMRNTDIKATPSSRSWHQVASEFHSFYLKIFNKS